MDSAIHKKTGKQYLSFLIWKKGLFENDDIHKEEWIAPSDEIENYEELKEDIFVTPVISHLRKNKFIPSFFRLLPRYSDRVILTKESELHKKLKTVISVLLTEEFDCSLQYDKEIYFIKNIPIDYEKLQKNIKKIEVRKNIETTNEYRIADILVPLVFNPFWGNGIVVEIRVSENENKKEGKEEFWFQRGYSIIWINEEDFIIEDGQRGLNKNIFDVIPFSIGYKKILDNHKEEMKSFLHEGWEELNKEKKSIDECLDALEKRKTEILFELDIKSNELKKTCRTCKHGTRNRKDNGETIACWFGTKWGIGNAQGQGNRPHIHEHLDGCDWHENC